MIGIETVAGLFPLILLWGFLIFLVLRPHIRRRVLPGLYEEEALWERERTPMDVFRSGHEAYLAGVRARRAALDLVLMMDEGHDHRPDSTVHPLCPLCSEIMGLMAE